ncbi:hypothetical protein Ciccas_012183 [Cichlidogyrus casuarinus]|uniref:Uncharacterized protein n=1 Tax=Cichlidogyrus casuarinus TaxID=1844966 RepID=A0ABD2PP37_9PLAT
MNSQIDTPTRKQLSNGSSTTSPLINGGGLGLSSIGRSYARSNLFRGSQPTVNTTPDRAESSQAEVIPTPDRNNSQLTSIISDMNRQLSECSAELARGRELNQQLQQQLHTVTKRLDDKLSSKIQQTDAQIRDLKQRISANDDSDKYRRYLKKTDRRNFPMQESSYSSESMTSAVSTKSNIFKSQGVTAAELLANQHSTNRFAKVFNVDSTRGWNQC